MVDGGGPTQIISDAPLGHIKGCQNWGQASTAELVPLALEITHQTLFPSFDGLYPYRHMRQSRLAVAQFDTARTALQAKQNKPASYNRYLTHRKDCLSLLDSREMR